MENPRVFIIVTKYFDGEKWNTDEEIIECSRYFPNRAGNRTMEIAREMDEKYGDSHFWTVTIKNEDRQDYYQLFHGRLS